MASYSKTVLLLGICAFSYNKWRCCCLTAWGTYSESTADRLGDDQLSVLTSPHIACLRDESIWRLAPRNTSTTTRDVSSHQEVIVSCSAPPPQKKINKRGGSALQRFQISLSPLVGAIGVSGRCARDVAVRLYVTSCWGWAKVWQQAGRRRVCRRAALDQRFWASRDQNTSLLC